MELKHSNSDLSALYIFGCCSTALEIADAARICHPSLELFFVVPEPEGLPDSQQVLESSLQEHSLKRGSNAGYILSMSEHAQLATPHGGVMHKIPCPYMPLVLCSCRDSCGMALTPPFEFLCWNC